MDVEYYFGVDGRPIEGVTTTAKREPGVPLVLLAIVLWLAYRYAR